MIVAFYDAKGERSLIGYQLKEGKKVPENPEVGSECDVSILIHGDSVQRGHVVRKWYAAADADIDDFLGVTGAQLAPKQWRALEGKQ